MNRCKPGKMVTKEHGELLKIILKLEEGRVPDRKEKGWIVEGEKRRVTRKECKKVEGGI